MQIIAVPRVLREKLGEDGVDSLIDLLNKVRDRTRDDVLTFVEEKFERRLSDEVAKINQRITDEVAKINQRLSEEVTKINQRITDEVAKINQRITEEVANINQRITDEVTNINQRISEEVAGLRNEIHRTRADIIKWMFIFWVGQIGVIMGLLFAFFK